MHFDAGRRALILAGLGMSLAGCAATRPPAPPAESAATTRRPSGTPSPMSEPSPTSSPTQSPRALPSRDDIIESFTGQVPQYWGLDVPGVLSRVPADAGGAVLTLDYCGGPGGSHTDHTILDLLRDHKLPATLFLNSRWIAANSTLAKELAEDPLFEIANHGSQHLPLSVTGQNAYGIPGTTNAGEVYDEIMVNTDMISELTGKMPRFFRSGTAHLDEVASQICLALGQIPTGFSINGDAGATHPAQIVTQELARAQSGDIIIAHGNQPAAATGEGLAAAVQLLQAKLIPLDPVLQQS